MAFGLAVRALLLASALPIGIQADEANYLYGALVLERFGIVVDHHRFLWPPGYVWFLSRLTSPEGLLGLGGGAAGVDAARWVQVAASGFTGLFTMRFAWRFASARAAAVAGVLWALHLPLAVYTHLLFSEALFLPLFLGGLWHFVSALERMESAPPEERSAGAGRMVLAGVLLGAALHLKELPLYLVPLLGTVALVRALRARSGFAESLRRATLMPLAVLVCTLPWTLRNVEVYDRPVVAGATLGENVYGGLNANQRNFDHRALDVPRMLAGLPPISDLARPWLAAPPTDASGAPVAPWSRVDGIVHPIDRMDANVRRGLAFVAEHPGYVARTRIEGWSDFVTPLSFFTRHLALGHYPEESALRTWARRPLVALSIATSLAALLGAALGACLVLRRGPARAVLMGVAAYMLAAASLVAMSRFRVPLEPFLIALAGGFLAHARDAFGAGPLRIGAALGAAALLAGLWWLGWPQLAESLRMAWKGGVS